MPTINPYDPTEIKNLIVGTADYRKAKAGEAFENLARGLGQIRNQVASNAMQRQAEGFSLANQAISGLANILQQQKTYNNKQSAILAGSQADDAVQQAMTAQSLFARNQQDAYKDNPQDMNIETFGSQLAQNQLGADGQPLIQGPSSLGAPDSVKQDIGSVLERLQQNPNMKHNASAYYNAKSRLEAHANQLQLEMDHVMRNRQTAIAGSFADNTINALKVAAQDLPANPNEAAEIFTGMLNAAHSNITTPNQVRAQGQNKVAKDSQNLIQQGQSSYFKAIAQKNMDYYDDKGQPDPTTALVNIGMGRKQLSSQMSAGMTEDQVKAANTALDAAETRQLAAYKLKAEVNQSDVQKWASKTSLDMDAGSNRLNRQYQEDVKSQIALTQERLQKQIDGIGDSTYSKDLPAQALDIDKDAMLRTQAQLKSLQSQANTNLQHIDTGERQAAIAQKHEQNEADREMARIERERVKEGRDVAYKSIGDMQADMAKLNPREQQKEIYQLSAKMNAYASGEADKGYVSRQYVNRLADRNARITKSASLYLPPASPLPQLPDWIPFNAKQVQHVSPTNRQQNEKAMKQEAEAVGQVQALQKVYASQQKYEEQAHHDLTADQFDHFSEKLSTVLDDQARGVLQESQVQQMVPALMAQVKLQYPAKKEATQAAPTKKGKGKGYFIGVPNPDTAPGMEVPPPPDIPKQRMTRAQLKAMGIEVVDDGG